MLELVNHLKQAGWGSRGPDLETPGLIVPSAIEHSVMISAIVKKTHTLRSNDMLKLLFIYSKYLHNANVLLVIYSGGDILLELRIRTLLNSTIYVLI